MFYFYQLSLSLSKKRKEKKKKEFYKSEKIKKERPRCGDLHSATGQLILGQLLRRCLPSATVMTTNRSWHWSCRCLSDECWWLRECWLLLLVAVWLLVAAAGCWMIPGCGCWLRVIAGCDWDSFAGEKVFEYFRDIDDFQLRQVPRRKSLWRFLSRRLGNKFSEGSVLISRWGWSEKKVRLGEVG